MATRGGRFAAIPNIPQGGITDWQFNLLTAMKENIELLTGARGSDNSARAITKGQLTVANPPSQTMTKVTAEGAGFIINNVAVPSLDDYSKLVLDVQRLANDVAILRAILNTLINQLKG
jgi:hypothetical protein